MLSFLGMLANLEVSANATGIERWMELLLALACGLVALWAMHRWLHIVMRLDQQPLESPSADEAD